nr:hypothetical protein Itr_chr13CG13590 [Ipomoea trifida]
MAVGESLRFDVAIMVGGCLRSFYGSRSVQRSPVEAAFGVGEDGCSAVVAVAEEREAFGVGSRKWRKWRVARGGGCCMWFGVWRWRMKWLFPSDDDWLIVHEV